MHTILYYDGHTLALTMSNFVGFKVYINRASLTTHCYPIIWTIMVINVTNKDVRNVAGRAKARSVVVT
jgi:hypothetical protein